MSGAGSTSGPQAWRREDPPDVTGDSKSALLTGILAAAPAAADEHPEAGYTADFSACDSAPPSGFEDVPAGHSSAGSIDCIAYYGVTKGTYATAYSLLMSVTREHMALFLIRLAGIGGIEVTSTPDDPGFTDTDEFQETHELAIGEVRPSRRLAIRLPQRSCPKGSTEAVCRRSRRYDDPFYNQSPPRRSHN